MRQIAIVLIVATLSVVASPWVCVSEAAPFHYNVDEQTYLGPGPPDGQIRINYTSVVFNSNQWTFQATAKNVGSQTYTDILFLLQYVYDPSAGLIFNDTTKVWSTDGLGGGNTMTFGALTNYYPMVDTDAPLAWTVTNPTSRNASLLATDDVPYISIGDLAPGGTFPINFVAQVNANWGGLNLVASFVSTTAIPEPSSVLLLGVGAAALSLVATRRMRARSK